MPTIRPTDPTLHNFVTRRHEKLVKERKQQVYTFLACTRREESPASVLREHSGLLQLIVSFLPKIKAPRSEDSCHYKVKIDMCTGTEHVHAEALYQQGGWDNENMPTGKSFYTQEWSGSLTNLTIGGAGFAKEEWMKVAGFLKNPDGSFLTEGQLRLHFRNYMRRNYCEGCGGKCIAIPGDTVSWRFDDPYRVVTGWKPGTDDELRERGWLHQGGWLYRHLELYREDPSQLDD